MYTAAQRATTVAPGPPSEPRLVLASSRARRAILDGGWWPRSRDPLAEVPGLVVALAARYGPIRGLMLNRGSWEAEFRRLALGDRVVRMGWFSTVDPAVLIATTDAGEQIDLLVVPPATPAAVAERAMAAAADPANRLRAPELLTAPVADDARAEDDGNSVWDNEGGHGARPAADDRVPAVRPPIALSGSDPAITTGR